MFFQKSPDFLGIPEGTLLVGTQRARDWKIRTAAWFSVFLGWRIFNLFIGLSGWWAPN